VNVLARLVSSALVIVLASTALAADPKASKDAVDRGRYLVNMIGCNDCHSPKVFTAEGPVPDPKRLMSGHPAGSKLPPVDTKALSPGYWCLMSPDLTAFVGPWGQSFAINLTPDEQTGIGLWTEEIFMKALRSGKHMGDGRAILPPMPWQFYGSMADDDMKAIFAYLRSLPPIKNMVPQPVAAGDIGKM